MAVSAISSTTRSPLPDQKVVDAARGVEGVPGKRAELRRGSGAAKPVTVFCFVSAGAAGSAVMRSTFAGAVPVTMTSMGLNSTRLYCFVSGSKVEKRIAGVSSLPGRRGTSV